jgi:hypothetical protein
VVATTLLVTGIAPALPKLVAGVAGRCPALSGVAGTARPVG